VKKKYIDWSRYDHLLGIESDKSIAKLTGCTPDNVRYRRKKFSIPPAVYSSWTPEDEDRLSRGLLKCVTCNKVKSLSCFNKEDGRKSGTHRKCKECISHKRRKKWETVKYQYIQQLGGKCRNCGYNQHLSPMQFHHVCKESKELTLSAIIMHKARLQDVLVEIDKCCLLCSNCHDAYHAQELDLEFKKQSIGWTVSNPQKVGSPSKICPTEDKGFTNELNWSKR
jgi:hypothetical protein